MHVTSHVDSFESGWNSEAAKGHILLLSEYVELNEEDRVDVLKKNTFASCFLVKKPFRFDNRDPPRMDSSLLSLRVFNHNAFSNA